jgi:nicotinamide-nucleotide amidase
VTQPQGLDKPDRLDGLVRDIVERLVECGQTVAVAESLTAGLVIEHFGRRPGVSAVLRGGVVAYASDLKTALLGVPAETMTKNGVVSAETAVAMASGVRRRCGSDWGIATTGVAGPDRQEAKPPGTVYVAVAGSSGEEWCQLGPATEQTDGSDPTVMRNRVRRTAAEGVLALLSDALGTSPGSHRRPA